MLEIAIALAAVSHKGQTDKGGNPYILHPLRVMAKMDSEQSRVCAVLHDVVEDCNVPLSRIEAMFGPEISEAIDALTRRNGEPYMTFIDRCAANPLAAKVKIADVRDNLDLSRLGRKPTKDDKRRAGKYIAARTRLLTPASPATTTSARGDALDSEGRG
jgi:hypothetical protein